MREGIYFSLLEIVRFSEIFGCWKVLQNYSPPGFPFVSVNVFSTSSIVAPRAAS